MKITISYAVEIKQVNKILRDTVAIYNGAVSMCVDIFEKEWDTLKTLDTINRKGLCDKLIHGTSKRIAKYPCFDEAFYKMPAYLRRSAIAHALGYLSSYHSNLENWEKDLRKKQNEKAPTLQGCLHKCPTFYNAEMFASEGIDSDLAKIKIYKDNDWVWLPIQLKHTDMQYIRKHLTGKKMSAPVLEHKHHKWFLRFSFESESKLNNTPINEQTILAVDLGINTDATCSVMRSDGTILARKFINFASDKDHLWHTLNKIKRQSKENGSYSTTRLWNYARRCNEELARKIARSISDYALEMQVDTVVFEHLDIKGKKRGFRKERLQMWRKNSVQDIVEGKAHRAGIRIRRVCAWNTSRLAFDGSGEILRGKDAGFPSNKMCRFGNGKIYNCDLSASYNIGARYFIGQKEKTISAKKWSDIVAKVPECAKRSRCVYATLLQINKVA